MFTSNLLRKKSTTSTDVKIMNTDVMKAINKFAKSLWFRIIKKPRQNQFMIIRLLDGTIQEGNGFSLDEKDIIAWYYYNLAKYQPYSIFKLGTSDDEKKRRLSPYVSRLNNNPCIHGTYTIEECLKEHPFFSARPEIYKADKNLQKRARAYKLLLIRYPYQIIMNESLLNSYIILDQQTGKLLGKEGWHTWTENTVREYLNKLEQVEIIQ